MLRPRRQHGQRIAIRSQNPSTGGLLHKTHESNSKDYTRKLKLDALLDSDHPFCYIRRAIAKCALRQYQEAINDLDQHLQIETDDVYAYRFRGKVNEHLGNLDAAKRDFQKALTVLSPNALIIGNIKVDLQRIEKRIREELDEQTLSR